MKYYVLSSVIMVTICRVIPCYDNIVCLSFLIWIYVFISLIRIAVPKTAYYIDHCDCYALLSVMIDEL